MSLGETVRAVLVHLLTPVAGLGFYVWLCRKMNKEIYEMFGFEPGTKLDEKPVFQVFKIEDHFGD